MEIPHQVYKIDLNNINEPLTRMIESVNDRGVRYVDVELWANSQKVTLSQNCTATAAFVTDGYLINESVECTIADDLTTVIVPIDNEKIESKSGIMLVEIKITDENDNILTPQFAFKVRVKKSITEDANIFEKSYGTVSEILKEVAEARGNSKTLKEALATKASSMMLTETGSLLLKNITDDIIGGVKLPTSAPSAIRAELKNFIAEGAISGIATGVYNVVDFGAVGDGVTDDTAAFVTCTNNANGRPVFVPPGTYVVNYANCGDGKAIYLLGIGNPTIIRSIAPDGNDEAPLFKFNNVPSAYISGITFNPQRDNFLVTATTTKAIDNSVIDETEYQEWIDTACLYFYRGGKNIVIENCTFTNCSREGIYCGKGEFADIIVRNNKFKETSACLWLRDGTYENVIFEDNYCDGCRTMPVEFDNTVYNDVASVIKNVVVRNNKFYNVCKCAVQFRAIDGLTVENNEYTNRGQLYEHGRKSSDDLKKLFIWGLGNLSKENTLFAQNINIKNNKGVTGTVLQLQPNSKCNGSVTQFKNVKVSENDFTVDGSYVVARCTENLSIVRNEIQGGEKSNLLRATAVRNVTIDKNNIESGARIYYEETVKTEIEEEKIIDGKTVIEKVTYTMVGDGENIKMIDNSANLTAAPFMLTNYGSNDAFAKVAFDLENNKLNTWNLIDVNQYYKSYFYSKSRNNVDTSGITSAALGSPTNNKYGFNANSVVDLHSLDTTDATAIDGYVILRSAVTFAFPGRKIQVIITGQAIKTDTSGTTENKILNEITVPAGGILTLTYTGSGWYAS